MGEAGDAGLSSIMDDARDFGLEVIIGSLLMSATAATIVVVGINALKAAHAAMAKVALEKMRKEHSDSSIGLLGQRVTGTDFTDEKVLSFLMIVGGTVWIADGTYDKDTGLANCVWYHPTPGFKPKIAKQVWSMPPPLCTPEFPMGQFTKTQPQMSAAKGR